MRSIVTGFLGLRRVHHFSPFEPSLAIVGFTADRSSEPTPRPFLALNQLPGRTLLLQARLPWAQGLEPSKLQWQELAQGQRSSFHLQLPYQPSRVLAQLTLPLHYHGQAELACSVQIGITAAERRIPQE